jgi:hypothetical protein
VAQRGAVEGIILQEVDLLPVEEMPVLLRCVVGSGGCLGVLDPVSNLVLNVVSYLDHLERPPAEELARRALLFGYEKRREAEVNQIQESIDMESFRNLWLQFACNKAMDGFTEFVENYFGAGLEASVDSEQLESDFVYFDHTRPPGIRVHLTVGNRSGYRGNRSYRSGSVRKKLGYRSLTEPSKP